MFLPLSFIHINIQNSSPQQVGHLNLNNLADGEGLCF